MVKNKIIVTNIVGLIAIGSLVVFFLNNQGASDITGMVIPPSLAANGENENSSNTGIPEECKDKNFDIDGFINCYMKDNEWKCELSGEGLISITQTNGSSMAPTITDDTLILLKKVSLEELETCDIVGFRKDNDVFLHRIVSIDYDQRCVTTKGDNNLYIDGCIKENDIIGKAVIILKGASYKTEFVFNVSDFILPEFS